MSILQQYLGDGLLEVREPCVESDGVTVEHKFPRILDGNEQHAAMRHLHNYYKESGAIGSFRTYQTPTPFPRTVIVGSFPPLTEKQVTADAKALHDLYGTRPAPQIIVSDRTGPSHALQTLKPSS